MHTGWRCCSVSFYGRFVAKSVWPFRFKFSIFYLRNYTTRQIGMKSNLPCRHFQSFRSRHQMRVLLLLLSNQDPRIGEFDFGIIYMFDVCEVSFCREVRLAVQIAKYLLFLYAFILILWIWFLFLTFSNCFNEFTKTTFCFYFNEFWISKICQRCILVQISTKFELNFKPSHHFIFNHVMSNE